MRRSGLWRYSVLVLLVAFVAGASVQSTFAQTSSSSNYKVSETQFGSSSSDEQCSGQYCARASIGNVAGSDSSSPTFSASFGPITSDEPLLEVIIDPGDSDFGDLSSTATAFKTTTVKIRTYLSNGYVLQITGEPPKYNGHTLNTPTSPTDSTPGTEQFGINLTDNSAPNVGASPVQVPSGQFSFGAAENDYVLANKFMYVSGDTVARSTTASGQTDYTISTIVNISNLTPAGRYTGDFSAVVIPFY